MSKYDQLTDLERNSIAMYRRQGLTLSKIGELIGRSTPIISREIKRNSKPDGTYEPAYAQALANLRRAACRNRLNLRKK